MFLKTLNARVPALSKAASGSLVATAAAPFLAGCFPGATGQSEGVVVSEIAEEAAE
ncbi:hypothetical protein [Aliigemmobacter aestuarii]|uniref:hypothetical protein n=1 Tax=Aliigemmobacter aestuarii TaxID=1445661 RepID=UPI001454D85D|nr:hypothetical protein [Gemmobacter aestuarii]